MHWGHSILERVYFELDKILDVLIWEKRSTRSSTLCNASVYAGNGVKLKLTRPSMRFLVFDILLRIMNLYLGRVWFSAKSLFSSIKKYLMGIRTQLYFLFIRFLPGSNQTWKPWYRLWAVFPQSCGQNSVLAQTGFGAAEVEFEMLQLSKEHRISKRTLAKEFMP
jgi:hypothetical protein